MNGVKSHEIASLANSAPDSIPCRGRLKGTECPYPARWDLMLRCANTGVIGGGPSCDYHEHQCRSGIGRHSGCSCTVELIASVPIGGQS